MEIDRGDVLGRRGASKRLGRPRGDEKIDFS